METAVLAEELTCSVCLGLFQDPVALPCQHSFCAKCINDAWDLPEVQGEVSCPQCRQTFSPRPMLVKNHTLQNIVEKYNRHPPVAATSAPTAPVMCEYCPTQALKTCLKCETSFCPRHLQPHLTKQIYKEHCLIEPTADLTKRQCPSHRKAFEFYCEQDEVCVCVSCTIVGGHKSHSLLSLEQAKDQLKEKLKNSVENIQTIQKEWSREQEDLKQSEIEVKRHSKEMKGKLLAAFSEWRKQLEDDENLALKMIDEEENRALSQIKSSSDSLLKKIEEIQKIDMEAQCQEQEDPLSFIQDVKQLLLRYSQLQLSQATIKKQEINEALGFSFDSVLVEQNRSTENFKGGAASFFRQRSEPGAESIFKRFGSTGEARPSQFWANKQQTKNAPWTFVDNSFSFASSQMKLNRSTENKGGAASFFGQRSEPGAESIFKSFGSTGEARPSQFWANKQQTKNAPWTFVDNSFSFASSQMKLNRSTENKGGAASFFGQRSEPGAESIFKSFGSTGEARPTEPQCGTLNMSAVRTVIQNKFEEYQKYQMTILEALDDELI